MATDSFELKAVLFDLDDTLNDRRQSWRVFVEQMAHPVAGHLGPCITDEVHRFIVEADQGGYRDRDDFLADLARLPWKAPKSKAEVETLWQAHFPQCTVTRPGVLALLGRLRELGIRTGIVTNGRDDGQRAKLKAMGLQDAVDGVVTSGGIGFKKPDPRIYAAALSMLGVAASDTLFVGDHPQSDVAGPAKAGMRTAWLANGREWRVPDLRPDDVIDGIVGLEPVLSRLHPQWPSPAAARDHAHASAC